MDADLWVVIDTHVVDKLSDDEEFRLALSEAAEFGRIGVIVTHLQIDEILDMPAHKVAKQAVLLQDLGTLPATRRPTAGAAWDVSRWDEGTWMSADDAASYDALVDGNPRHAEDVFLVLTARRDGATLVTNDKGARSRAAKAGIPTMSIEDLRAVVVES